MSNEMKDYVDSFRANLPSAITYDETIARYFCNNRRFLNEWEVERYLNYISKFGFQQYDVGGDRPELILDFVGGRYFAYPYSVNDIDPDLVLDFVNETYEAA